MTMQNGMGLMRFLMVLSSFAPLFILWGFRGTSSIPDEFFIPACAGLVIIPNLILFVRIVRAKKRNDIKPFKILEVRDQKDHVLVYLFAMLIPLYDANIGSIRDFYAVCAALVFILFLFWKLNLHYLNFAFSVFGYGIYTIIVESSTSSSTKRKASVILISKQDFIDPGKAINAYRISNTVFLEKDV